MMMKTKSTITRGAVHAMVTLLLMIVSATTAWAATVQFSTTSGGSGTSEDPYHVKTIDDLNKLSADVNSTVAIDNEMNADYYDLSKASVDGMQSAYQYTGSAISLGDYTVKNVYGDVIAPSNYTAVVKNGSDDEVATVTEVGSYQLVITPDSDSQYTDTLQVAFSVTLWGNNGGWCGNPDANDGQNIYYEITETAGEKTFTIRKNPGVAADSDFSMADYEYDESEENCNLAPWMNVTKTEDEEGLVVTVSCDINHLVIEDGVTSIGDFVFPFCANLSSITLPQSVKSIGDYAFSDCTNLLSVSIPTSVTIIGYGAFRNCTSLATVVCYAPFYAFASTPILGYDAFGNNAVGRKIYVFSDYVSAYRLMWWQYDFNIYPILNSQVTVADEGYATYYNRLVDVQLPAGMKACIVTAADDSKLTYVTIADGDGATKTVPAGTAVVLKVAAGATPGELTPLVSDVDTRDFSETNLLHGSDIDVTTTGSGQHYKLTYGDDGTENANVLAWYLGSDNGAPFESPAHEAWLVVPDNADARPFFGLMEETTTEIVELEESLANQAGKGEFVGKYYDLQGRPMEGRPQRKGIYIRGNRPVVVTACGD